MDVRKNNAKLTPLVPLVHNIVGYVNMEGYSKWLKQNYGFTIQYQ